MLFLELPRCYLFRAFMSYWDDLGFVKWSCRPFAVVAVVRSSSMVVVCFSETLMRRMLSANHEKIARIIQCAQRT